jgi:hypothetical protein
MQGISLDIKDPAFLRSRQKQNLLQKIGKFFGKILGGMGRNCFFAEKTVPPMVSFFR